MNLSLDARLKIAGVIAELRTLGAMSSVRHHYDLLKTLQAAMLDIEEMYDFILSTEMPKRHYAEDAYELEYSVAPKKAKSGSQESR